MDTFTEQDVRLFESVKDKLACGCGNTLWGTNYDLLTHTYTIYCLNCHKNLALRELYNVNFKTNITVNTSPMSDCDIFLDKTDKVDRLLQHIQELITEVQTLRSKGEN